MTTISGRIRPRQYLEYPTEHVSDRAEAYGFEGVVVDGTDVLAVYREAKRAVENARQGGGPTLVECVTLRMEGHGAHDDSYYVPRQVHQEWAERDPIERYGVWLRENVDMTDGEEVEISESVKRLLASALKRAEASPLPDPDTLLDGVYAEPGTPDGPEGREARTVEGSSKMRSRRRNR